MAAKKRAKKAGGPFVAAAVFCQTIVEDSDGVVSALRVVDELRGIFPAHAPDDFPSKEHPAEVALFVLIIIRRGDAPAGKHRLELVSESPKGETQEVFSQEVEMPPYPNGAVNVKARLAMKFQGQGVYWFDVVLGGKVLTRMALNIMLQRDQAAARSK